MFVLSSPSGAGKTTIAQAILERDTEIVMSVSLTTRPKRPGEVAARDYHFVDTADFNLMVNRGDLLEYAKVFNHYYGTPVAPVMEALESGKDVLFDIDWQGTQQLAEQARADLVSVFILPPSTSELEKRLRGRAQDSAEVVANRMSRAPDELSHYPEYDYIVVNREINKSIEMAMSILSAERLKRVRQTGLGEFVKGLREGR
ncbi:MAG: guanylate kinase [Pseudomonadota bacterium]|nr:guanylate kinase [Pseudomonadota bacterium]